MTQSTIRDTVFIDHWWNPQQSTNAIHEKYKGTPYEVQWETLDAARKGKMKKVAIATLDKLTHIFGEMTGCDVAIDDILFTEDGMIQQKLLEQRMEEARRSGRSQENPKALKGVVTSIAVRPPIVLDSD